MKMQTADRFPNVFEDIMVYFNVNDLSVWRPITVVEYNDVASNWTPTEDKSAKVAYRKVEYYD